MAFTFKVQSVANIVIVLCLSFTLSYSERCGLPSRFWCDSKETASRCGVLDQCQQQEWTRHRDASPVDITLYYESLCPDCRDFWTKQLFPTYQKVGSIMNITLVPYGNAKETQNGAQWKFECQHGAEECQGNLIETCTISLVKNISVYLPFIHCMEASDKKIEKAAEKCSKKFPSVPLDQVMACSNSSAGNALEHQMALMTEALSPSHTYVPWVTLNGVHTEQIEKEADSNLIKLVCDSYKGQKPSACGSVSERDFKH